MPAKKTSKSRKRAKPQRKPAGVVAVRESGPRKWLFPLLESAYTVLTPRDGESGRPRAGAAGLRKPAGKRGAYRSQLQPGEGENVLAAPELDLWVERLREYKQRKAASVLARRPRGPAAGAFVPGAKNWTPLGPSVVLNGQAHGFPAVGGRIAGIAVAPGGQLVYAASANGGVFRSDDAGQTWRSLMDAFDLDPTNFASTSLACGAIAIDLNDPNRIYVGTGEGDTHAMFSNRILNALPAYRGIGPIRSDDGGATWQVEPTAAGSPSLAGKAFFALAVDPANRENVIAATTDGLYQR
ncbi:MAG TPA: sialidase family protein, partial [Chthoniobacterales bacterium]|nr:sialidase family protein [Chthoniobacterales bacterium]